MADRAVLIGIDRYPGFTDLRGSCNDVDDFRSWLVDPAAGGLSPANVTCISGRDYPPPQNGIRDARPNLSDLADALRPIVNAAAFGTHEEGRLFLYVAGHGFADVNDERSAALYSAEASVAGPFHLAVTGYAGWLVRHYAFDEIIVIMDTCRLANTLHTITPGTYPNTPNAHGNRQSKWFYAFASRHGQPTRERSFGGRSRGIFTATLLEALRNASPNRLGRVTGSAVKNYIHNAIDTIAADVAIEPPEILLDDHRDVLFVERGETPRIAITFALANPVAGHQLVITDPSSGTELERFTVDGAPLEVALPAGFYKARVVETNESKLFEVMTRETIPIP